ncbi:hypothetical protein [Nocardioides mangrovicus]|uniref:hypothetical protein n=1 Tax=Nocardioides mangrovicus TaxID=2478913 RepID=UPI0011C396B9|nr:hypothetical protein [Nocardioides mangrovicus]
MELSSTLQISRDPLLAALQFVRQGLTVRALEPGRTRLLQSSSVDPSSITTEEQVREAWGTERTPNLGLWTGEASWDRVTVEFWHPAFRRWHEILQAAGVFRSACAVVAVGDRRVDYWFRGTSRGCVSYGGDFIRIVGARGTLIAPPSRRATFGWTFTKQPGPGNVAPRAEIKKIVSSLEALER